MRIATPAVVAGSPDGALDDARDWQETQAKARETAASDAIVGFMDGLDTSTTLLR
jgi:hypothetical protein